MDFMDLGTASFVTCLFGHLGLDNDQVKLSKCHVTNCYYIVIHKYVDANMILMIMRHILAGRLPRASQKNALGLNAWLRLPRAARPRTVLGVNVPLHYFQLAA